MYAIIVVKVHVSINQQITVQKKHIWFQKVTKLFSRGGVSMFPTLLASAKILGLRHWEITFEVTS